MTLFYLSPENWSPRFDHTFFTVKLESAREWTTCPPGTHGLEYGRHNHPAVYYQVTVLCEHQMRILQRRYSQFKSMYEQDEEFIQNRLEQLQEFVRTLLQRPGYCTLDTVKEFFELDSFAPTEERS